MVESELVAKIEKNRTCLEALSKVFWNSPNRGVLAEVDDALALLEQDGPEIAQGIALVRKTIQDPTEQRLREIAIDYAHVFIGHHPDDPFPYESVYTSENRLMMQDARDNVLSVYRTFGYAPFTGADNEPEDHVSIELAFEADLCRRAIEAPGADEVDEAGRLLAAGESFRVQHLCNWVPTLCADIEKRAETDFFRGIAKVTAAYVNRLTFF